MSPSDSENPPRPVIVAEQFPFDGVTAVMLNVPAGFCAIVPFPPPGQAIDDAEKLLAGLPACVAVVDSAWPTKLNCRNEGVRTTIPNWDCGGVTVTGTSTLVAGTPVAPRN